MKKELITHQCSKVFCILLASITITGWNNKAYALGYTPPTFTEILVGNGTNPNCANIDYTAYPNFNTATNPQLFAIVADAAPAGTGTPVLYVDDGFSTPVTVTLPYTLPGTYYPDVVIGDNLNIVGDYAIGVALYDPSTTNVDLLVYDVAGQGTGTLTVTLVSTVTGLSGSVPVTSPPRIDIIGTYSTTYTGGFATCDNFALTYIDGAGIQLYSAKLSAPTPGTVNTITGWTNAIQPDIAAIERTVGTNHLMGLVSFYDNMFGFTYSPFTYNKIRYVEWDITTNSFPSGNTIDAGWFTGQRIDAIDNYLLNSTTGGNDYFTVVATGISILATTAYAIPGTVWEYSPFTLGGGTDLPAAGGVATNQLFSDATVTCGAYDVTNGWGVYTIDYFTSPTGPGFTTYFSQQKDWANTILPGGGPNYWQIPANTVTGTTNAVSSTSNNDGVSGLGNQQVLACWDDGTGNIYYKYAATPFTFKPAPQSKKQKEWKIAPNPATSYLFIISPDDKIQEGSNYTLTDVLGHTVMQGNLSDSYQQLNINGLPNGIYITHLYRNNEELKSIQFVKQ